MVRNSLTTVCLLIVVLLCLSYGVDGKKHTRKGPKNKLKVVNEDGEVMPKNEQLLRSFGAYTKPAAPNELHKVRIKRKTKKEKPTKRKSQGKNSKSLKGKQKSGKKQGKRGQKAAASRKGRNKGKKKVGIKKKGNQKQRHGKKQGKLGQKAAPSKKRRKKGKKNVGIKKKGKPKRGKKQGKPGKKAAASRKGRNKGKKKVGIKKKGNQKERHGKKQGKPGQKAAPSKKQRKKGKKNVGIKKKGKPKLGKKQGKPGKKSSPGIKGRKKGKKTVGIKKKGKNNKVDRLGGKNKANKTQVQKGGLKGRKMKKTGKNKSRSNTFPKVQKGNKKSNGKKRKKEEKKSKLGAPMRPTNLKNVSPSGINLNEKIQKQRKIQSQKDLDVAVESTATACKRPEGSSEKECVHFNHVSHKLVPIMPFKVTSSKGLPECALDGDCARPGSCSFIIHNNTTKDCYTGNFAFVAMIGKVKKYNPADPVEEMVSQELIKGMSHCPNGEGKQYIFSLPNGKCYTVSTEEVDLSEGQNKCLKADGELVSIGKADQEFLSRWLMGTTALASCSEFWTSAIKNKGTGEYLWNLRGKPVQMTGPTYWALADKKHDHIVLSRAHKFGWIDKAASHRACVLCEA